MYLCLLLFSCPQCFFITFNGGCILVLSSFFLIKKWKKIAKEQMLRGFPVTNWQQTFMYSVFHCQNILRDFIKRGLLRYRRTAEGSLSRVCAFRRQTCELHALCDCMLIHIILCLPAVRNTIRFATHVQESQVCTNKTHTAAQRHTEPCSVNAQVEFSCLILFSNLMPHLAGYSTTMRELFTVLHFYRLFAFASHSQHQHDASDGIHLSETWSMRIWGVAKDQNWVWSLVLILKKSGDLGW